MSFITKLRKLFSLDGKTMLLFIEAYCYLGAARILIMLPFSRYAEALGERMQETPETLIRENTYILARIHDVIGITGRHTFWKSQCLVRAIAAMKMLHRRKIDSTLYLGTGKDEAGCMIAHAWLRSGPFYITGSESMERFTVVGTFAKQFHIE